MLFIFSEGWGAERLQLLTFFSKRLWFQLQLMVFFQAAPAPAPTSSGSGSPALLCQNQPLRRSFLVQDAKNELFSTIPTKANTLHHAAGELRVHQEGHLGGAQPVLLGWSEYCWLPGWNLQISNPDIKMLDIVGESETPTGSYSTINVKMHRKQYVQNIKNYSDSKMSIFWLSSYFVIPVE